MAKRYGGGIHPLYHVPTLIIITSKTSKVKRIDCLNVANVMENMALAATELGLGSIYLTAFLIQMEQDTEMLKHLGIPTGYVPLAALGVGYASNPLTKNELSEVKKRITVVRR